MQRCVLWLSQAVIFSPTVMFNQKAPRMAAIAVRQQKTACRTPKSGIGAAFLSHAANKHGRMHRNACCTPIFTVWPIIQAPQSLRPHHRVYSLLPPSPGALFFLF